MKDKGKIAVDPKNPAAQVSAMMVYQFSYWLRFIIPAVFLLGAIASFFANFKRISLLNNVRYDKAPVQDVLAPVSWREFEMLVGQFFREKGYKVTETAKYRLVQKAARHMLPNL